MSLTAMPSISFFNLKISLASLINHETTLKILEFILSLIEKVNPGFLFSSMCMFPELNGKKF